MKTLLVGVVAFSIGLTGIDNAIIFSGYMLVSVFMGAGFAL